jgi:tetratricopeptide (TPR) repeat protein
LEHAPFDNDFTNNIGYALYLAREHASAASHFTKCLEADPSDSFPMLNLADAYFALNRVEDARAVLRDLAALPVALPSAWHRQRAASAASAAFMSIWGGASHETSRDGSQANSANASAQTSRRGSWGAGEWPFPQLPTFPQMQMPFPSFMDAVNAAYSESTTVDESVAAAATIDSSDDEDGSEGHRRPKRNTSWTSGLPNMPNMTALLEMFHQMQTIQAQFAANNDAGSRNFEADVPDDNDASSREETGDPHSSSDLHDLHRRLRDVKLAREAGADEGPVGDVDLDSDRVHVESAEGGRADRSPPDGSTNETPGTQVPQGVSNQSPLLPATPLASGTHTPFVHPHFHQGAGAPASLDDDVVGTSSCDHEALFNKGYACVLLHRFDDADEYFDALLCDSHNHVDALYGKALAVLVREAHHQSDGGLDVIRKPRRVQLCGPPHPLAPILTDFAQDCMRDAALIEAMGYLKRVLNQNPLFRERSSHARASNIRRRLLHRLNWPRARLLWLGFASSESPLSSLPPEIIYVLEELVLLDESVALANSDPTQSESTGAATDPTAVAANTARAFARYWQSRVSEMVGSPDGDASSQPHPDDVREGISQDPPTSADQIDPSALVESVRLC